ncbi:PhnA domain-containing protein [Pedobacter metabolipauper]|uniref:Phosphonoacetate hydrolase n=1 Tax=Pedobacter metabolipauper TaxID=425513 RepID=A0A4R6ST75_9SPHI|nr:alkylphosphonate utilization protein [Pedobacter metabolipauper]TDQ08208.1 phosphonoacetate hydrolase [Pedobacter metabolipauper]
MKLEEQLIQRSGNKCELCQSEEALTVYEVPPQSVSTDENTILICETCLSQIEKRTEMNSNHWRCLSSCMWSEIPGVQVISWRMLNRLNNENWASDNLDMMYIDDERLAWAKAGADDESDAAAEFHKDANGNLLQTGDSVVLTKTLDVKGSSLSAKLGTVVKNIRLVEDNTDQIEGRIEGQVIVILTKYVRRQG